MRELSDYDWHSDEARAGYQQIQQMLQREVLDAQFAGMKQALSGNDPESMQRVRDMLADLNQLLADHARGVDTPEQFDAFMDQHGEFFPDHPSNVEELIDSLARRQAAAERMMRSMSREQRAELAELMQQALGDVDLQSQLAQLQDNLSALRPGMMRGGPVDIDGEEPLGYGDAVGAVSELADLEALEQQLAQDYPGASLDDIDVEALERQLPARDVADLRDFAPSWRQSSSARATCAATPTASPSRRRHCADSERAHCAGSSPSSTHRHAATTTTSARVPPTNAPARSSPGTSATSVRSTQSGRCRTPCSAAPPTRATRRSRLGWTSTTSSSPRPSGVRRPRSRSASTCRSRWSRRIAGGP